MMTSMSIEQPLSRRALLRHSASGFGMLALAAMLAEQWKLPAAEPNTENPLAQRPPHFAPRAKRVIFLFMHGGPSHIDTFDPKPRLIRDDGKSVEFYVARTRKTVPRTVL